MINKEKLIQSAMLAFIALATSQSANCAVTESAPTTERCYGLVRAGMNDCATATSSCAGSSTKDSQADAFVLMPIGLCEKLVGGHLPPSEKKPVS